MSRPRPFHLVAFAAITIMAGCGGDGGGNGPVDPPDPPANRPPVANVTGATLEIPVGPATISTDVSSHFSDPDGDALTISATTSDASVATVSVTGSRMEMTGVSPGTVTVTVTARDPGGLTASYTISVTVNGPPVLTDSIPNHVLAEGASATVDLDDHFTDPDDDVASYEAESSDASVASVSVAGSTATITGVSAGTATVTFTVRDEYGQEANQEVGVTVEDTNQAPRATDAIPAQELMPEGEVTVDLSGHFTDPDDDALTYEGETSDAAVATVAIDGNNATITGVAAGTATITFTASDPDGLSADQVAMVTVNTPPMPVGTIDSLAVRLDADISLVVSGYFSDADGDELTYEAESSNDDVATASLADSTLTISGEAVGTATITITATDPVGASAMQAAVVSVKTAPAPDSIPPTHDMVVGNHVELDFSTFFTDEDGDELTYTAVTSNAAVATASVDGSVVTTTAADAIANAAGTVITLTVTATDPAGLSAEQEAMVRVSAAEYDTLSGLSVDENGQLTGSLGGITIALTSCLVLDSFPVGQQFITAHWTEWQLAAGTGWVTAPRTRRPVTAPGPPIQHLPRPRLGGPPGGHLPDGREHDDRDGRHPGNRPAEPCRHRQRRNQHAAVAELREQAGGWAGPGRVLQQLAVRPVGCRSAQPRVTPVPRASRIALPGCPARRGTSRESRGRGARECRRGPGSPRIHPIREGSCTGRARRGETCGNRRRNVMSAWQNVKSR